MATEKLDHVDATLLFDLYGPLLTDHQQQVWQLYWFEDWSLSEIAESHQTSRAAVYDGLDRTQKLLHGYETKLGLMRSWKTKRTAMAELGAALSALPPTEALKARALAAYVRIATEEGLNDV